MPINEKDLILEQSVSPIVYRYLKENPEVGFAVEELVERLELKLALVRLVTKFLTEMGLVKCYKQGRNHAHYLWNVNCIQLTV